MPRVVSLGLWTMCAVMGAGIGVASIGYLVLDEHCLALRIICIGFGLIGLGPVIGSAIVAPAWRTLDTRVRAAALVFAVWGAAFIAITIRFAAHYSACW